MRYLLLILLLFSLSCGESPPPPPQLTYSVEIVIGGWLQRSLQCDYYEKEGCAYKFYDNAGTLLMEIAVGEMHSVYVKPN